MGKLGEHQLPIQQPGADLSGGSFLCPGCALFISRIFRQFNFKCVAVLLLSFAVFVSAAFWVLPLRSKPSGFDAERVIKHSASVQASFKLPKPVSELIPHIARLEYDIFGEIGVPNTTVAVLSMHQGSEDDWTDVVFGIVPDPLNARVDAASVSMLKILLIELFDQQSNLTLTNSTFGQPFSFEILKFPGGITVIPKGFAKIWRKPLPLFNFTLNNSVIDINNNYDELKEQLTTSLNLWPHENLYIQVTNEKGSTRDRPVTVEASVTSDNGDLPTQRLKQLAQIISKSPSGKNLGLDNSVFGRVKEVRLSSFLNNSVHAAPPFPSPAPSPVPNDDLPPSNSPSPAPTLNSPAPATVHCAPLLPPSPSPSVRGPDLPPNLPPKPPSKPPVSGPTLHRSAVPSPSPPIPENSGGGPEKGNGAPPPVLASMSPSESSGAEGFSFKELRWFCLLGLWTFYLFCLMS